MKVSLWVYSHRYGTDVLKILVPNAVELSVSDVVHITGIDWEGELLEHEVAGEAEFERDVREDEFLDHDVDIPVGNDQAVLDELQKLCSVYSPREGEAGGES